MGFFINVSNHASTAWSEDQIKNARLFGDIVDIPFPDVEPLWDDSRIDSLVQEYFENISSYENPTAMVQGEFVFSYRLVSRLKNAGIKTVAACSKRISTETTDENGHTLKTAKFVFQKFREY